MAYSLTIRQAGENSGLRMCSAASSAAAAAVADIAMAAAGTQIFWGSILG
ncbi:MAG: hypothetical protein J2P45_13545 [Candidatus Dormibacteraeota bacterium]|nr:hypothetical protein [Candidatus Dormibacteraeota bacterium]